MIRGLVRKLSVRLLYTMSDVCFYLGDRFSDDADEVWRDRRWKQLLRNESRLDGYCVPDTRECDHEDVSLWPGYRTERVIKRGHQHGD